MIRFLLAGFALILSLVLVSVTASGHEYSYKHYHNYHDDWDRDRDRDDYYDHYKRNTREREYWDWYYDDKSGPDVKYPTYVPVPVYPPVYIQNIPSGYEQVVAWDSYCGCNVTVLVPIR